MAEFTSEQWAAAQRVVEDMEQNRRNLTQGLAALKDPHLKAAWHVINGGWNPEVDWLPEKVAWSKEEHGG